METACGVPLPLDFQCSCFKTDHPSLCFSNLCSVRTKITLFFAHYLFLLTPKLKLCSLAHAHLAQLSSGGPSERSRSEHLQKPAAL